MPQLTQHVGFLKLATPQFAGILAIYLVQIDQLADQLLLRNSVDG
jgi:hypothetical protein